MIFYLGFRQDATPFLEEPRTLVFTTNDFVLTLGLLCSIQVKSRLSLVCERLEVEETA